MTTQTERELRQEWETPDDFFGVVNSEFEFQLDAAANQLNKKCAIWMDSRFDALRPKAKWVHANSLRVWVNPGFSGVDPWMGKAYVEAQKHLGAVVVVMALISPSTKWWRDWALKASEIRLLGGRRVQFKAPPGIKQSSNSRENCLVIFRPNSHHLPPHIWTWDWAKDL